MASSQDKAIALKDAYVKGIVDATSEAPVMPEQDMGDTASIIMDINRGNTTMINDGDPRIKMRGSRGNFDMSERDSSKVMKGLMQYHAQKQHGDYNYNPSVGQLREMVAQPLKGRGYGARDNERMTPDTRQGLAETYHYMKNNRGY